MNIVTRLWMVLVVMLTLSACAQTQTPLPQPGTPEIQRYAQANEKTWTPRIQNGDLLEFVKLVQEATGKLFVIDPRVKGQVTIVNNKPLNSQQMYNLLVATLDVHGFTAVEVDNIVRIIPKPDAKTEALEQR